MVVVEWLIVWKEGRSSCEHGGGERTADYEVALHSALRRNCEISFLEALGRRPGAAPDVEDSAQLRPACLWLKRPRCSTRAAHISGISMRIRWPANVSIKHVGQSG